MLARAALALLALTTALAVVVAASNPASSLPVEGYDEPLNSVDKSKNPASAQKWPLNLVGADRSKSVVILQGIRVPAFIADRLNRYPTGYKPPPYTYGNSIDSWGSSNDEESMNGEKVDSECLPRPGDAQHPFREDGGNMNTPHLNSQGLPCKSKKEWAIGIDLRENEFSVGIVHDEGKPELILNEDGQLYTPAYVKFISDAHRAIVGHSALSTGNNTTSMDDYETKNQVDLSKLKDTNTYKVYPQDVYFGLRDTVPGKTAAQVEVDILTVLMQRAVDMAEAYTGGEVSDIKITYPKKVLKYGPRGPSFLKFTEFDERREQAVEMAGNQLEKTVRTGTFTEVLALMFAHVPFFESHLQPNPDVPKDDPVFLSQMVLMYNLRDSSEDLVVMRYTKGYRSAYHLDFLAGYLPNDGNIYIQFSQYLANFALDRFNRGVGAGGKDRGRKDAISPELLPAFEAAAKRMSDSLEDEKALLMFRIAKDSSVIITLKEYRECRMQFLKERLQKSVRQVLEDAALMDDSKIDHLIVADDSEFKSASTVVLENIVFGRRSHKKAVSEVDPKKAIALGACT
ncbi:hypothetical protein EMPS_10133 [Entomortierella parvispora]|uniref:Uncharacterized protein n=1 Tax=Entomortierella parvispora TaxID=205924 RepID=A0A9P3HJB7_9FUNG|nr:hypothetical protein EMPS_10133 [Entomortierella parvispora]